MNEQCPFFNGDGSFKCNPILSIPAAKIAIGYEGAPLLTVQQEDLCKSTDNSRETSCPAFKNMQVLGIKSQFAKPVVNNRPLR